MGLGAILEHTWTGIGSLVRPHTATALFRRADRYRNEGRYTEAQELVARGLAQAPDSIVGHLLSAYLCIARREIGPAKHALLHVLELDRFHPRALLGLARIALEEDDPQGALPLLDRALQLYPEFPEAQALRDMVASWKTGVARTDTPARASGSLGVAPPPRTRARHLIVARGDGSVVRAGADISDEQRQILAHHLTRVQRMASAILARAGAGLLQRGMIEAGGEATFLTRRGDLFLAATLPAPIEIEAGLAEVDECWATLGSENG